MGLHFINLLLRNTSTSLAWRGAKSPNITSMKDILRHQCINVNNVTDCIEKKTFELSDVVGNAWIGGVSKTSLMDPSFWIPDFTWARDGRCYTLNYSRNIADDYEKDIMMFGSTYPNRHQIMFIHDANFFAISDNPKAFSMMRTKAMNNTFRLSNTSSSIVLKTLVKKRWTTVSSPVSRTYSPKALAAGFPGTGGATRRGPFAPPWTSFDSLKNCTETSAAVPLKEWRKPQDVRNPVNITSTGRWACQPLTHTHTITSHHTLDCGTSQQKS